MTAMQAALHLRRRLGICLLVATTLVAVAVPTAAAVAPSRPPVWAYYYIWFNISSWNRAKRDFPVIAKYSSDEPSIMREHIRLAKDAGIEGFIVSWKSRPVLDKRLALLIRVAKEERFKLAIMYQGLDFERRPLPVEKISLDLTRFERHFAGSPVFAGFGKPLVVWSGTWAFSRHEIERVVSPHRDRLRILGSERNPADFRTKADLFDGDAYYWSSVNPATQRNYVHKLAAMGQAVHDRAGLWFAPAAPGFDGRLIGHPTVVAREHGDTLRRELNAAQRSNPDVIGLISWNEFSENTQVEPSHEHGTTALEVLADAAGTRFKAKDDLDSSQGDRGQGPGPLPATLGFIVFGLVAVWVIGRRKRANASV
jgi:hypothetical protein